jgi:hypothetical protein
MPTVQAPPELCHAASSVAKQHWKRHSTFKFTQIRSAPTIIWCWTSIPGALCKAPDPTPHIDPVSMTVQRTMPPIQGRSRIRHHAQPCLDLCGKTSIHEFQSTTVRLSLPHIPSIPSPDLTHSPLEEHANRSKVWLRGIRSVQSKPPHSSFDRNRSNEPSLHDDQQHEQTSRLQATGAQT